MQFPCSYLVLDAANAAAVAHDVAPCQLAAVVAAAVHHPYQPLAAAAVPVQQAEQLTPQQRYRWSCCYWGRCWGQ